MGHTHGISKKTRSTLAAKFADAYRSEILESGAADMPWISKLIGCIPQEDGSNFDVEPLMLDAVCDSNGKLSAVEVRDEEGVKMFAEPIERATVGLKTEIVFINEGKGTVRKFEITVPADTV